MSNFVNTFYINEYACLWIAADQSIGKNSIYGESSGNFSTEIGFAISQNESQHL